MSLAFLLAALAVVVTPGTGVVYTLAAGLSHGRRAGLVAAFGCTLAVGPHLLASVTGLAALLASSPLAYAVMETGQLERHLRLLRARHVRRRDAVIAAVREHLPGAAVHGAAAGLHLTVTYAPDVPDTEVAAAALALGVKCHPLSWHRQLPGSPGLVLGYAADPPGTLTEGVALLGEALRSRA